VKTLKIQISKFRVMKLFIKPEKVEKGEVFVSLFINP